MSRTELECPECGSHAPPAFVQPPPRIYQCDRCGARTPHSELRARHNYSQTHGLKGFDYYNRVELGPIVGSLYVNPGGVNVPKTVSLPGLFSEPSQTIVVCVGVYGLDPAGTSAVSAGGVSFTKAVSQYDGLTGEASIWYAQGIPIGSTSIAVTVNTFASDVFITASRLLSAPASPLDKTSSLAGSDGAPSTGATGALSVSGETCFACILADEQDAGTLSWTAPFVLQQEPVSPGTGIGPLSVATLTTSSQSSVTASATLSFGTSWRACIATFKATS